MFLNKHRKANKGNINNFKKGLGFPCLLFSTAFEPFDGREAYVVIGLGEKPFKPSEPQRGVQEKFQPRLQGRRYAYCKYIDVCMQGSDRALAERALICHRRANSGAGKARFTKLYRARLRHNVFLMDDFLMPK